LIPVLPISARNAAIADLTRPFVRKYGQAMRLIWDRGKATSNFRKHRVSFAEAAIAISDPLAVTGADPDHSHGETRWITFGLSRPGRLLAIAHTEESDTIRIISARVATRAERVLYEEGQD
jgi:uncharacterized DUF497 family protein